VADRRLDCPVPKPAHLRPLAALALLATLTACAGGPASGGTPAGTATSGPAPTSAAAPSNGAGPSVAQLGHTLETIALKASDFNAGFDVTLISGGDKVKGQVTLDNCGYNFTTESRRVARRQYAVLNNGQNVGLMNELVAYATPADAAKALRQWHAAAAHCPHTAVHSTVAAMPPMVETIHRNEVNLANLPVKTNASTYLSAVAKGQGTEYDLAILQVHGRYLDNIYAGSDRPFTQRDRAVAFTFATITGKRLAALP
jgi:hypothetical protein